MLWSNNSDESQDSTDGGYAGLYRWTMDALFGSRVSPSRKYREFAQDDTNYKRSRRQVAASSESPLIRSNSWSELGSTFCRRNDLLPPSPDGSFDQVPRRRLSSRSAESLLNPFADIRRPREEATDTFAGRRKKYRDELDNEEFSIRFQSPRRDDPVVSKLFESSFSGKRVPNSTAKVPIPGKFPSPLKQTKEKDYTADYLQILDQLSRNEQILEDVNREFGERQAQFQAKEQGYREKYLQTRSELIDELKHSKKLYDNYYKLYAKYQQLRELSQHTVQLRQKVADLESQLVDDAIDKEKQIHDLTRKVFELELKLQDSNSMRERDALKYNARIAELEKQASLQPELGVSSLSFSPSHLGDQSSDYNAMVDSQFLKNLA